jgi:hypothetical protein
MSCVLETSLTSFAPSLWIADGDSVSVAGFRYPTRMAVIRLGGGGLFVWSPVALTDALRAAVDELGSVRFIVAPNSLHHLYIGAWVSAYPGARVFAAPGLAMGRRDLRIDGELGDAAEAAWAGEIDQVLMRSALTTEAVFFHRASGTVLFTDLVQHFPPGWFKGWRAVVARLDRMTGDEPAVPQKFRLAFTDRKAARASLARILAWPVERVLMAHGVPLTADARGFLVRAFRWLSR